MNSKKCDVEVFSRVTGFFRPVQTWNEGKTEEFNDRKRYGVSDEMVSENAASGASKDIAC